MRGPEKSCVCALLLSGGTLARESEPRVWRQRQPEYHSRIMAQIQAREREEIIKPRGTRIGVPRTFSPPSSLFFPRKRASKPSRSRRIPKSFTMLFRRSRRKKHHFNPAFTTRHVPTFTQLPILPIVPRQNFRSRDTRATCVTIQIIASGNLRSLRFVSASENR